MEERKYIEIRLSTILLVVALIVIAILVSYFYKVNIEKNSVEKQITELGKKNENVENSSFESNNNDVQFSDDDVTNAFTNYLKIFKETASTSEQLEKLGLLKEEYNAELAKYNKTNIKYKEFKNTVMNYVTEELFNKINYNPNKTDDGYWYKEQDGLLYFYEYIGTGIEYEVENISFKGDNTYIATVNTLDSDGQKESETNIEFTVTSYNGRCVLDVIRFSRDFAIEGTYICLDNEKSEGLSYTFNKNTVIFEALYSTIGTFEVIDEKIKITYTEAYDPEGEVSEVFPNGKEEVLTIVDENTLITQKVIDGVVYNGKYVK